MAKKENLTFQDRLKAWWETDTAKAVATIVAVLLIPASVIAWNYATTQGRDIRNQLSTDTSAPSVTDENTAMEEDSEEADSTEETPADTANSETVTETAQPTEQEETPAIGGMNEQAQEPAATDTDSTTDQTTGGLGSVEKLPNTSSDVTYTTIKGDTVYGISLKVCGNESFYLSNTRKDFLKVGETLRITCN